jgi:hypothetical protein
MEALTKPSETPETKKLRRKLKKNEAPVGNDPVDSLRILVRQHRNVSRMSVAVGHMGLTEVTLKNGDVVKRDIPADIAAKLEETSTSLQTDALKLKSQIEKALRDVPIYEQFFKPRSFTCPMLAAYLIADVTIKGPPGFDPVAYKSSQLRRFCGLAVINGRLERLTKGEKRHYNVSLRTQLYLAFEALWKNRRHYGDSKPECQKYLKIWDDAKHRDLQKEGVREKGVKPNGDPAHVRELADGKVVAWDGHAHSYGWHKAADILIEDMYVVWRALEGLPVWPSFYAAKLGYEHGGKISVNAPKMMTLEEALELVK